MDSHPHPASPEHRRDVVLGVIGGSGLYEVAELADAHRVTVDTPFGPPSAEFTVGRLPRKQGADVQAVFVPRHGPGHRLLPSEINYRANVHGLKQLGVTHLLSVSAVGSLQEAVAPGHIVFPDQFIDRTRGRAHSFFGEGVVGHVQFGEPVTAHWVDLVARAAQGAGAVVHRGGTCVVMEGPAFSTKAESNLYRTWGARVIGMTALPEAKLAREAELAYALMALSTDYDCWREEAEEVSVNSVVEVLRANVDRAKRIIVEVASRLPETTEAFPYPRACENAVITAPAAISESARRRLDLIIGHYLPPTP